MTYNSLNYFCYSSNTSLLREYEIGWAINFAYRLGIEHPKIKHLTKKFERICLYIK